MNSDNTARLTTGPVPKTVLFLALPMVVGLFSIIAFNLADTFFIGAPLAFLGAHFWAFLGLLCATAMSDMSASIIAWASARRVCRTEETKLVAQESAGYS